MWFLPEGGFQCMWLSCRAKRKKKNTGHGECENIPERVSALGGIRGEAVSILENVGRGGQAR